MRCFAYVDDVNTSSPTICLHVNGGVMRMSTTEAEKLVMDINRALDSVEEIQTNHFNSPARKYREMAK